MFAHVANVPTIYIHNIQVESETVGLAASDNTRLPLAVRLRLGVFYEQLQSCGLSFYINKSTPAFESSHLQHAYRLLCPVYVVLMCGPPNTCDPCMLLDVTQRISERDVLRVGGGDGSLASIVFLNLSDALHIQKVEKHEISAAYSADLLRGYTYLMDVASCHGVPIYRTVAATIRHLNTVIQLQRATETYPLPAITSMFQQYVPRSFWSLLTTANNHNVILEFTLATFHRVLGRNLGLPSTLLQRVGVRTATNATNHSLCSRLLADFYTTSTINHDDISGDTRVSVIDHGTLLLCVVAELWQISVRWYAPSTPLPSLIPTSPKLIEKPKNWHLKTRLSLVFRHSELDDDVFYGGGGIDEDIIEENSDVFYTDIMSDIDKPPSLTTESRHNNTVSDIDKPQSLTTQSRHTDAVSDIGTDRKLISTNIFTLEHLRTALIQTVSEIMGNNTIPSDITLSASEQNTVSEMPLSSTSDPHIVPEIFSVYKMLLATGTVHHRVSPQHDTGGLSEEFQLMIRDMFVQASTMFLTNNETIHISTPSTTSNNVVENTELSDCVQADLDILPLEHLYLYWLNILHLPATNVIQLFQILRLPNPLFPSLTQINGIKLEDLTQRISKVLRPIIKPFSSMYIDNAVIQPLSPLPTIPSSSLQADDYSVNDTTDIPCSEGGGGCVFLGGSCNPSTWRRDVAVPFLEQHQIIFFNPQLATWSIQLVLLEALIKSNSSIRLFVIDSQTRSIASLVETVEAVMQECVVVVVMQFISEGQLIRGERVSAAEAEILNRARRHTCHLLSTAAATGHEVVVLSSVFEACQWIEHWSKGTGSVLVSGSRTKDNIAEQIFTDLNLDKDGCMNQDEMLRWLFRVHSSHKRGLSGSVIMTPPTLTDLRELVNRIHLDSSTNCIIDNINITLPELTLLLRRYPRLSYL